MIVRWVCKVFVTQSIAPSGRHIKTCQNCGLPWMMPKLAGVLAHKLPVCAIPRSAIWKRTGQKRAIG
ncbi:hypothetical protein C6501_04375 [Candidatus Poribacteria bacterium]|nr:MAG: hypothetical protein C6501_04375 [Candidatus Poribacteria bacterium]